MCFLSLLYQLALPPVIGLADNGDYLRVAGPSGIYHLPTGKGLHFDYFQRYYRYDQPRKQEFVSAHIYIVKSARLLNTLFGSKYQFDIVYLGILQALILSVGIYIILLHLSRLNLLTFILGGVYALFVLTDTTQALFFNSFYTESSGLCSMMILIALILVAADSKPSIPKFLLATIFYFGMVIFLSYVKVQYVILSIPFSIVYLLTIRKMKWPIQLAAWLIAIIAVAVSFNGVAKRVPDHMNAANIYNLVFKEFLTWSDDPAQTAKELGISEEYIIYADTVAYNPDSGFNEKPLQGQLKWLGRDGTIKFLLRHPDCLYYILSRAAPTFWNSRLEYLGDYTSDSGMQPRAQAYKFPLWSEFSGRALNPPLFWFFAVVIISIIINLYALIKHAWGTKYEALFLIQSLFIVVCLSQLTISIFGDGTYEIAKHLFLGRIAADGLIFFIIGILISRIYPTPRPQNRPAS